MQRLKRSLLPTLLCACVFAAFAGCQPTAPPMLPNSPPPAEIPAANVPVALRQRNWTDRGQGSCVHASTTTALRWLNRYADADKWRRSYGGGETATGIMSKLRAGGFQFVATTNADPAVLDYATTTRRGAIIWFFQSHCVFFAGWARVDGEVCGLLIDNNRPENTIAIPRDQFLRRWRGYGGFAAVITTDSPTPPLAWPAYRPQT
jgi:hypothetical protein